MAHGDFLGGCDGILNNNEGGLSIEVYFYPNPFTSFVTINYEIFEEGITSLNFYNNKGELVESVAATPSSIGNFQYIFYGENHEGNVFYLNVLHQGSELSSETYRLISK